MWARQKL